LRSVKRKIPNADATKKRKGQVLTEI